MTEWIWDAVSFVAGVAVIVCLVALALFFVAALFLALRKTMKQ